MKITRVDVSTLQAHNIRSAYDDDGLKRLAASLREKQEFPITITSDGKIVNGHRRVAAALLGGVTHLDAVVRDALTAEEITEAQILNHFHAENLSDYDRAVALRTAKTEGVSNNQIAEKFHLNPGTATKYLSLFDCPREVQEAARSGKLGVSKWYACSKSPEPKTTLALLLNGARRDDVAKAVRRRKHTRTVRTSRIKCPLLNGHVVTVAGKGVSLEDAIELLVEAAAVMKSAVAKGLNAKTATRVWSDIAAAG